MKLEAEIGVLWPEPKATRSWETQEGPSSRARGGANTSVSTPSCSFWTRGLQDFERVTCSVFCSSGPRRRDRRLSGPQRTCRQGHPSDAFH